MHYPDIVHHGAVQHVTGSCHQLLMDASNSLLIDCGSVQAGDLATERLGGWLDTVRLLVVTHVHNDHVGRIPELLAEGFKGPILCSEASARLLPLVMEDVLIHAGAHDRSQVDDFLAVLDKRVIALPFAHWFTLLDTPQLQCRLRLQRAGHILGSAYVECELHYPQESRDIRVVFSGDLGASHTPILQRVRSPERADVLVLESTYGDRLHEDRSTRQLRLEQVIDRALEDQGTVLLPAFSIGRTQELLYELEDILRRKGLWAEHADTGTDWPQLPVILDSPLASRFTRIYQDFEDDWEPAARVRLLEGRAPLAFRQLITLDTHSRHLQTVNYLASTARPAIVIAGHGMCAGGRIVNYLKAMLEDPRHNVVFVGYQAKGTPGAAIQQHGPRNGYVELERQRYTIRAGVCSVSGYSAHADQRDLVEFVTAMDAWPAQIRLVHGEAKAKKALAEVLGRKYRLSNRNVELLIPGGH